MSAHCIQEALRIRAILQAKIKTCDEMLRVILSEPIETKTPTTNERRPHQGD